MRRISYAFAFLSILVLAGIFASAFAGPAEYIYDDVGRLTKVVYDSDYVIEYVYDDMGNRLIRSVTSPSSPEANFTASPESGPAPLIVTFADQSTGTVRSWSWIFGDGESSTEQNPVHTYSSPGTYTVFLTVSDGAASSSQYGTIAVNIPKPVADFIPSPASGPAPLTVTFADSSTGNITGWAWNFGDGATSTLQSPSHTYANPGAYSVSLTVDGPGGQSDPRTVSIAVNYPAPVASFSASPTKGILPLEVQFTDLSTGNMTNWSWDFGDGSTSTSRNPSHTYAQPGNYTVRLTVNGPGGSNSCTQVSCVTVNEQPPEIDQYTKLLLHGSGEQNGQVFTDATGKHTPSSVNSVRTSTAQSKFGASSICFNNSRITYPDSSDWYFSGNQDFTVDFWLYTADTPNYGVGIFGGQNPGTGLAVMGSARQIGLVTNGAGHWVLLTQQLLPLNTWNHVALVRYNGVTKIYLNGVADPVTYSGSYTDSHAGFSIGDVYDPSISINYYTSSAYLQEFRLSQGIARWTSNFIPPSLPYGAYYAPPVASFSVSPTIGYAPLTAQFTDTSIGAITDWWWDFGDGSSSTSRNPSHTYTQAGNYTASLTVSGPKGTNTATLNNYISAYDPQGIDQFKLLLHGNGEPDGQAFTDATGKHTPSSVNSVRTSTAQSKFGGSSICFNKSRITYPDSSDWYFSGNQDFTVDFWLYTADTPNYGVGIFGGQNSGTGLAVRSSVLGPARQIGLVTNGAGHWVLLTQQLLPLNTWNHVALVRYNGVTKIYLNGVADPVTYSGPYTDSHAGFSIGDVYDPSISSNYYTSSAYLQEFRLTQGIARWTSNFIPPSGPFDTSAFIPPSSPSIPDGSTNVPVGAILSWTGGNFEVGDVVRYIVMLDTDNPPQKVVSSGKTDTRFDPSPLQPDTTYYWQIISVDKGGATTPGPIWQFKTAPVSNFDIAVSISGSPSPATVASNLTYTVSVSNLGPESITGVVLTDTLPSGVTFVSASASQGECPNTGNTVTCNIGSLTGMATVNATIVVKPTQPGNISNSSSVSGNEQDPVAANNTATVETEVRKPRFDLSLMLLLLLDDAASSSQEQPASQEAGP